MMPNRTQNPSTEAGWYFFQYFFSDPPDRYDVLSVREHMAGNRGTGTFFFGDYGRGVSWSTLASDYPHVRWWGPVPVPPPES